jgi:hypothetical protein
MTRYFFDTHDGKLESRDTEGEDLPDVEAAEVVALQSLFEIAEEHMPKGGVHNLQVEARDTSGTVLTLTLKLDIVRAPTR